MNKLKLLIVLFIVFIASCTNKNADTIIFNAKIYTVDSILSTAEAMVIKNKKIIAIGNTKDILEKYNATEKIDAKGKIIYPGFIDAHCHFLGYGLQLQTVNLVNTKSWDEVINKVTEFVKNKNIKPGDWITGRGWDQNDWSINNFPNNEKLNALYPNNPILLTRIDGHAAIANKIALQLAKVEVNQQLVGGTIETKEGKLTGLLVDNAVDLINNIIPKPSKETKIKALQQAQKNCFAVGLTTIDDCGIDYEDVQLLQELYANKNLQIKVYAMLSDAEKNYSYLFKNGIITDENLTVRSFKLYGDGALGSRGACLLQHYNDNANETGFLLSKAEHFDSIAKLLSTKNMQMCTHAIGDSANRTILKIYAKYLKGKNNLRWRIEHAQILNYEDLNLFGQYNIIPSVQPTHATSDMYWASSRLGNERIKTAYVYNNLLKQNNWLPLGTDFPVEDISPIKTFYAATIRKDDKNFPANGFQIENALSRENSLKGMTIWAAKSNFEEKNKGSLEVGKYADFIILDTDLMKCETTKILNTKVESTWINGVKVYWQ